MNQDETKNWRTGICFIVYHDCVLVWNPVDIPMAGHMCKIYTNWSRALLQKVEFSEI